MAERSPAPGGGSSAAWTCALAAALVEMAAAFAPGASEPGSDPAGLADRARALRESALALAERELESYGPVLDALRSDPGPERDRRLQAALSQAAESPLAIARCAVQAAELGVAALVRGSRHLRGDAVTGVLLAEAACAAAVQLVELNLEERPDDPRLAEASQLAAAAAAARRQALG